MPEYTPTTASVRGVYAFTKRGNHIRMERESAFDRWLAAHDAEVRHQTLTPIMTLLEELTDPDPCWFDHRGGCQAHGFLSLEPGQTCPHHDAKVLAEQWKADS